MAAAHGGRFGVAATRSRRSAGAFARGDALQRTRRRQAHPPALVFATARAVGLSEDDVEAAACAIELVHVYSLVHDDLPAMDNDDLRRGRPTCHKAYDDATALLVGDALQPLAFQLLARDPKLPASPAIRLRLIEMLAQAIGTLGMAGGQAIDLAVQGRRLDIGQVEDMHARKTGAVIRASVLMAAECAPPLDSNLYGALSRFANAVGLAFQIQDDLLDVTGDASLLGKATGADVSRAKPTIRRSSESPRRSSVSGCCTVKPFTRSYPLVNALKICALWPTGSCRDNTD